MAFEQKKHLVTLVAGSALLLSACAAPIPPSSKLASYVSPGDNDASSSKIRQLRDPRIRNFWETMQ